MARPFEIKADVEVELERANPLGSTTCDFRNQSCKPPEHHVDDRDKLAGRFRHVSAKVVSVGITEACRHAGEMAVVLGHVEPEILGQMPRGHRPDEWQFLQLLDRLGFDQAASVIKARFLDEVGDPRNRINLPAIAEARGGGSDAYGSVASDLFGRFPIAEAQRDVVENLADGRLTEARAEDDPSGFTQQVALRERLQAALALPVDFPRAARAWGHTPNRFAACKAWRARGDPCGARQTKRAAHQGITETS
jgi:hypothetical protein